MIDRVGQQLGNYRLTRRLGHGGFAEVYLGEHIYLDTQAAIKVLYGTTQQEQQHFHDEARKLAKLKHPHIVRILEFGVDNTLPYLVMEYAPQGSLRNIHPSGSILPLSAILSYIKPIAAALQYAHDQKIIHRDVKSDNMLIAEDDQILLSDFGLAITAHRTSSFTRQDKSGTLVYMPPEQVQGKASPASDQYSLGITVYEWLCGIFPFDGYFDVEIIMKHVQEPPPPFKKDLNIPSQVEQVVLKALAKDPKARFSSVQEFATALEQVSASPAPTIKQQTAKASPPVGTILSTYRDHSAGILAITWSPDGRYIASGSTDNTVQVFEAFTNKHIYTYKFNSSIESVDWLPDGIFITVANGVKPETDTVQVFEAFTSKQVYRYEIPHWCFTGVWSPDGRYIISKTGSAILYNEVLNNSAVQTFKPLTGNQLYRYKFLKLIKASWSPDVLDTFSDVQVYEAIADTQDHIGKVPRLMSRTKMSAWSPDGKYIAAQGSLISGTEGTVQVYEVFTGKKVSMWKAPNLVFFTDTWSPNGRHIATGGMDGSVRIFEAFSGKEVCMCRISHLPRVFLSVAWSPDGKYIATGGTGYINGSDDFAVHVLVGTA